MILNTTQGQSVDDELLISMWGTDAEISYIMCVDKKGGTVNSGLVHSSLAVLNAL